MHTAGLYRSAAGSGYFLPVLIALSIFALVAITPAAGASLVNLTLVPQNATHDPSVPLPVYAYGEPVTVNATLVNTGSGPVTVMGYPPKAGIHYRIAYPFRTFDRVHQAVVLGPGGSLSSQVLWDQKDARGMPVGPGRYTVAVYYLISKNATGSWDESDLDSVSSSVDLLILPPGGAYQGTIAVNESLTKENVTATLESVSFSNASWSASVLFRFPDNETFDRVSTCNRQGREHRFIADYGIDYAVDARTPRPFFDWSKDCRMPGAERFVFSGEPVPADAQNISLNITAEWTDPTVGTFTAPTWNYLVNLSVLKSSPNVIRTQPAATRPAPVPFVLVIPALAGAGALVSHRKAVKK